MGEVKKPVRPGASKRCVAVSLVLMGGAAGLCAQEQGPAYQSVDQCVQAGTHSRATCEDDWRQAQAQHAREAPKFKDLATCEAEYGAGKCEKTPTEQARSGTGFFMPMMMGYMMGSMLGGRGGAARALYQKPGHSGLVDAKGTPVAQPARKTPTARQEEGNKQTTTRGGFGLRGARASS